MPPSFWGIDPHGITELLLGNRARQTVWSRRLKATTRLQVARPGHSTVAEVLKIPLIWNESGLNAREEGGMTANVGNDRLARDIEEIVAAFDLRCVQKIVGEKSQTVKELFPETLKKVARSY